MQPDFYYITVATLPHPVLENLKRQVQMHHGTIRVLGSDENRPIGWQSRGNFGIKLGKLFDFLQDTTIPDAAIILFTDAYDVACFGDHAEILAKYASFSSPIVFGGEKHCNPDPSRRSDYPSPNLTTEFPFLNSGLFIGRAWALRECMEGYVYNDEHDDQRYWTGKYLRSPDMISIDHCAELFLNTVDMNMDAFSWDNHRVRYNDRSPTFVHVNGPDKQMIHLFMSDAPMRP